MYVHKEETVTEETSRAWDETFVGRHIGPRESDVAEMLATLGCRSLDELAAKTLPESILSMEPLGFGPAKTEAEVLRRVRGVANQNQVFRSFIGMGFYGNVTPPVIQRNILENPGWYTPYTPYQAEVSQGRLEAMLNFQTMVMDLTGMEIANASLLDEGTAAAEAMAMFVRVTDKDEAKTFFISDQCHPHVRDVVITRAEPLGLNVIVGDAATANFNADTLGVLLSYPHTDGTAVSPEAIVQQAHSVGALVVVTTDLLSLCVLESPGKFGADAVVGNSQRFGVPFGFGGPHAAFLGTRQKFARELPGRLAGVSKDSSGKPAYRLTLQTREQHIRRDRATSNICTAQVLLAVMASMYAIYHGPQGLKRIASVVRKQALAFSKLVTERGAMLVGKSAFDTVAVKLDAAKASKAIAELAAAKINVRVVSADTVSVAFDETVTSAELAVLVSVISGKPCDEVTVDAAISAAAVTVPAGLERKTEYLSHPVFNSYHSEHELLRYMNRLQAKDLSLTSSMIPLGSCTMKLNATVEMIPVSWPEFGGIHPFAPATQTTGYLQMVRELEAALGRITKLPAVLLTPNAGSQGEYAGLLTIRAYHMSRGEAHRNICLIPDSAHGTNPASAVMVGMKVVSIKCDDNGNVDVDDIRLKVAEHKHELSALMVTYPSTHGVFEEQIREICNIIHDNGGQVYMDGANLNAQVGLCYPGDFGVDVCHINLHKTFCIPHGGGGPGVGPICAQEHLRPFLPRHPDEADAATGKHAAVVSAPYGSASILPISWIYIQLMGDELATATKMAILSANYMAKRLEPYFCVLYKGANGFVAHECILDLRRFKKQVGIDVTDMAKRLMDYGFHAPTVSWPVVETFMIEPTESESKAELDRYCDAMIAIHGEISDVESGKLTPQESPLRHAPHTAEVVCATQWDRKYSREEAAYPALHLRTYKFWPAVGRIDSAYGDRNLFCSCIN